MNLTTADKIVKPTRFSIVNVESADWGKSDWFIPFVLAHLDLWTRKSNGLIYSRCELQESNFQVTKDSLIEKRLEQEKQLEVIDELPLLPASCAFERIEAQKQDLALP